MKRKKYGSDFKAKVAFEALKGEKTISALSTEYGVHPNQITLWKKQLREGMKEVFSRQRDKTNQDNEELQNRLYQQIGKLKVELDWLKKKVL